MEIILFLSLVPHDLRGASPMGNPFLEEVEAEGEKAEPPSFTLAIISRRSSHRAGLFFLSTQS